MNNDNLEYNALKQNILRFSNILEKSNNNFLVEFSKYLKELYNDDKFKSKKENDSYMEKLEDFLSELFLIPRLPESLEKKGCALLGATPFDKLEFVKLYLKNCGLTEYCNDKITKKRFIIFDCEGKSKKANTLFNIARKYKDIPFVIFNNCENILNQEDVLVLFKGLIESDRKLQFEDADGEFKDFIVKSYYILLGSKNKMNELLEKTQEDFKQAVSYRINTFHCFIEIVDLDELF